MAPHEIAWPLLFWAGGAAALMLHWSAAAARMAGLTRFNPVIFLGCFVRPSPGGAINRTVGAILYVVQVALVAPVVYGLAFEFVGHADMILGLLLGGIHGTAVGLLLPVFARWNPCVRDGRLPQPGLFGHRFGALTPLGIYVAHLVFGLLLGYIYVVPGG